MSLLAILPTSQKLHNKVGDNTKEIKKEKLKRNEKLRMDENVEEC